MVTVLSLLLRAGQLAPGWWQALQVNTLGLLRLHLQSPSLHQGNDVWSPSSRYYLQICASETPETAFCLYDGLMSILRLTTREKGPQEGQYLWAVRCPRPKIEESPK